MSWLRRILRVTIKYIYRRERMRNEKYVKFYSRKKHQSTK